MREVKRGEQKRKQKGLGGRVSPVIGSGLGSCSPQSWNISPGAALLSSPQSCPRRTWLSTFQISANAISQAIQKPLNIEASGALGYHSAPLGQPGAKPCRDAYQVGRHPFRYPQRGRSRQSPKAKCYKGQNSLHFKKSQANKVKQVYFFPLFSNKEHFSFGGQNVFNQKYQRIFQVHFVKLLSIIKLKIFVTKFSPQKKMVLGELCFLNNFNHLCRLPDAQLSCSPLMMKENQKMAFLFALHNTHSFQPPSKKEAASHHLLLPFPRGICTKISTTKQRTS